MKKNSLTANKGLSLSQAQSISNLCNQRAIEIAAKFNTVNNYSKSVTVGKKTHQTVKGKKLPENTVVLIKEKASLHACQAFLMENIKAKELMLAEVKRGNPDFSVVVMPDKPNFPKLSLLDGFLTEVTETWGWEQLSATELNEFLEAEAFAAHIGQFIHKDSILNGLRRELPEIPAIEWMTIKEGEKSPVEITVHHTAEELLVLHEELAALHRQYEQRVNYFKAKVKNLTTEENARIAKHNADVQIDAAKKNNDAQAAHETAYNEATQKIKVIQTEFEKERQEKIKNIAAMRISVDNRFQETIDLFLKQISAEQE